MKKNDLEKRVVRTLCWSINEIIEPNCCYCKQPAKYRLSSWFGLHLTRNLCEDHKIEFMLRRKERE